VRPTHIPIPWETGGLSPGVKRSGLKLNGAVLPLLHASSWRAQGHGLRCYVHKLYAIFAKSVYLNKTLEQYCGHHVLRQSAARSEHSLRYPSSRQVTDAFFSILITFIIHGTQSQKRFAIPRLCYRNV
jgi:hypothetical protein